VKRIYKFKKQVESPQKIGYYVTKSN